jgi:hypothetical protein
MVPRGQPPMQEGRSSYPSIVKRRKEFHEMTGNVGDVILMHPLMVHSALRNSLRIPHITKNLGVALKQPFNFDRERCKDYSLVELTILQALGKDRLKGWRITAPRERVVPDAWKVMDEMKRLELKRLAKVKKENEY